MRGIDKFKERFAGHDGEYVLIGGGACDLLFGEAGQDFRATKDLDLVLLVEALTPEFGQVFWDSIYETGRVDEAVDQLLDLFRRDREWNDGAARAQLFIIFDALKPQDPIVLRGRRKLSSMIFA